VVILGGVNWLITALQSDSAPEQEVALVPGENELLIHYEDGEQCLLSNWSFEYRRTYNGGTTRQGGWVVTDLNEYVEIVKDHELRFYATSGPISHNELNIHADKIEQIRFEYLPEEDESLPSRRIARIRLDTAASTLEFEPQDSPASYRKRFIIPVAEHYFPGHFDRDYRKWRRASVGIAGDLVDGCKGYDRISLTAEEVTNYRVPVSIEFPAS